MYLPKMFEETRPEILRALPLRVIDDSSRARAHLERITKRVERDRSGAAQGLLQEQHSGAAAMAAAIGKSLSDQCRSDGDD
jgi:hypothetical protein